MKNKHRIDKPFLYITISLVVIGFIIFLSAALGLTTENTGRFTSIIFKQFSFGLLAGSIVALALSHLKYTHIKKYSLWFFIFSIVLTALVFIPKIGFEYGGARRWISLGFISFQPAELLKIAFILYLATWYSNAKKYTQSFKYGLVPFLISLGIVGLLLLLQPDTDTFIVTALAGLAVFFTAGGKIKHILLIGLIGIIAGATLVATRPYVRDRVMTFLNPASDPLASGYQIQQSLISIGSGGIFGRGFGQSVQKFNFLPEPIGDSIFAVFAEEFGFIGALALIALFITFTLRGYRISTRAPDTFSSLVVVGLVTMIVTQSFMNISAMLGLIPLSGLPLLFISHGGTALLFTLASVGIIMNISRYQRT